MNKQHIRFLPYGGLCNRLNAVATAVSLATSGRDITVLWLRKPWCAAAFHELFEPMEISGVKLYSADTASLLWQRSLPRNLRQAGRIRQFFGWCNMEDLYPHTSESEAFEQALARVPKLYVSTCQRLLTPTLALRDLFKPITSIQMRIDAVVDTFSPNTYGLHIRRGDHDFCRVNSPLEAFIQRMDTLIAREPDACFYVATDDATVRDTLAVRYPNRIRYYEGATLSRSSVSGMQDAVVDLFVLSRTKAIYGSLASSFSEVAAELGGIPLEMATLSQ